MLKNILVPADKWRVVFVEGGRVSSAEVGHAGFGGPLETLHELPVAVAESLRSKVRSDAADDQLNDHFQVRRAVGRLVQGLGEQVALDGVAVRIHHLRDLRMPAVCRRCLQLIAERSEKYHAFPQWIRAILQ